MTERQTMVHKILHRKLIEQHKSPPKNTWDEIRCSGRVRCNANVTIPSATYYIAFPRPLKLNFDSFRRGYSFL